jgi:hypothetical protein
MTKVKIDIKCKEPINAIATSSNSPNSTGLDTVIKTKIVIKCKEPKTPIDCNDSDRPLVISFDIGIINMAYCLAELATAKIVKWGTIDLTSGSKTLKCKTCKADAYFIDGYCRIHRSKSTGGRNFTTSNSSEFELRNNLVKKLDLLPSIFLHENINVVLLEKQPRVATEKVKGLGHTLYDYYLIKHRPDDIIFVNANNKLAIYQGPSIVCPLATPHARNKWFAIEYCKWVLRDDHVSSALFSSFTKKDDPADAFLQLYWYVHYSRTGIVAKSSNSKNVKWDLNSKKYKSIKARSPGKNKGGKYTIANIKYIVAHNKDYENDTKVVEAIKYSFGSLDDFKNLGG